MPLLTPHVPGGLIDLMKNLAKEVLRDKPENIYEFAAVHFEKLIQQRDGSLDKDYEQFVAFQTHFDGQQQFAVPANSGYTCQRPIKIQPILHTKKSKSDMLAGFKAMESINEEDVLTETPYSNEKYQNAIYVIQRYYRRYVAQKKKQSSTTLTATTAAIIIQRTMRTLFANKIKLKTTDEEDTAKHDGVVQDDDDDGDVDNVSEAASYTSSSTIQMLADSQEGRENRLPGREVALLDVSGAADADGSTGFKEQTTVTQDPAPIIPPPPSTTEGSEADGKSIADENGNIGSIHQEETTPNHHTPAHDDDTSTAHIGKLSTIIGSNDQQNSLHTHTVEIDSNSSDPKHIITPVVAVGKTPQSLGASPNTLQSTSFRPQREQHFAVHLQGNAYAENSAANPYQSVAHIRKFDPNTGESLKTYDVFSQDRDDPDLSDSLNESTMERDSLENEDLDVDSLESNESMTHVSGGIAKREVDQDYGELYGNTNEVPGQEKQDVHQSVQLERAPTYLYGIHPARTPIAERKNKRSRNPSAESTKMRDNNDLAMTVSLGIDDRTPEERSEEESLESKGSTSEESSATQIENVSDVAHKIDKKAADGDDLKSYEGASTKIDAVDGVPSGSFQKETSSAGNALAINSGEETDDVLKHGRDFSIENDDSLDDTKTPVDGGKREEASKGVLQEATQMNSERFSQKTASENPEIHKSDDATLQIAVDKGLSEEIPLKIEDALSSKKPPSGLEEIPNKLAHGFAKSESLTAEVEDPGRLQKPIVSPLSVISSKPPAAIEDATQIDSEASRNQSDDRLKEVSVSGTSGRASDKMSNTNTEKLPEEEGLTVEGKGSLIENGTKDGSKVPQTTILEQIETADDQSKTTTRRHKRSLQDADLVHADTSDQEPSLALESVTNSDENLTGNMKANSKSLRTKSYSTNKHEKQVKAPSRSSPLGYFATLYSDQGSDGTMSSITPDTHDQQVESQLRELQSLTDLYPGLEIKDVMSEFHTRDIQPDYRGIDEDFLHDDAYKLKFEESPKDQKPSEERKPSIEVSRTVDEKTEGEDEDGQMGQRRGLHESKEMRGSSMDNSKIKTTMEELKMEKDEKTAGEDEGGHMGQPKGLNESFEEMKGLPVNNSKIETTMEEPKMERDEKTEGEDEGGHMGQPKGLNESFEEMKGIPMNNSKIETTMEEPKMEKDEVSNKDEYGGISRAINTQSVFGLKKTLVEDSLERNHKSQKISKGLFEPGTDRIGEDSKLDTEAAVDENIKGNISHTNREDEKIESSGANMAKPEIKSEISKQNKDENSNTLMPVISSSKLADKTHKTIKSDDVKPPLTVRPEPKLQEEDYFGKTIDKNILANDNPLIEILKADGVTLKAAGSKLPKVEEEPQDYVRDSVQIFDSVSEKPTDHLLREDKIDLTDAKANANLEVSLVPESWLEPKKEILSGQISSSSGNEGNRMSNDHKEYKDTVKEQKSNESHYSVPKIKGEGNSENASDSMTVKGDNLATKEKNLFDNELTSSKMPNEEDSLVLINSEKHPSTGMQPPLADLEVSKLSESDVEHLKNRTRVPDELINDEDNIEVGKTPNDTVGEVSMAVKSEIFDIEDKYRIQNKLKSNKILEPADILALNKSEKHASTDIEPRADSEMSKLSESGVYLKDKTGLSNVPKSYKDNVKEGKSGNETEVKNKMFNRSAIINTDEKYRDENGNGTESENKMTDRSDILNTEEKHRDENENDTEGKSKMADRFDTPNTEEKYRDENENDTEGKSKTADRSDTVNTEEKHHDKNENDTEGKNNMADRSDTPNTEEKYRYENENDTEGKSKTADRSDILNTEEKHRDENENDTEGKSKTADRSDILNTEEKHRDENENDTKGKNKMADRSDTVNTEEKHRDENENATEGKNKMADRADTPYTEEKHRDENENDTEGKSKMADRFDKMADRSDTVNTEEKHRDENENDTEGKSKTADRSDILNTEEKHRDENENDTKGKNKMADRSDTVNTEEKHRDENENATEGKNKMADRADTPYTEEKHRDENENDTEGKNKMVDRSYTIYTEEKHRDENENATEDKIKMADRSDSPNTEEKYRDENDSSSSKIPKHDDSLALTKTEKHASTDIKPAPSLEMSKYSESGVEHLEHRTTLHDELKSDENNVKRHKSNENQGPISKRNEGENREKCADNNDEVIDTNDTLEESKAISIAEAAKKHIVDKELTSNKTMKNDNHSPRIKAEQLSLTDTQTAAISGMTELLKVDIESPQDISSNKLGNLDDLQRESKDSISKKGENENERNDDDTAKTSNKTKSSEQISEIGNDRLVESLPTSIKFVKLDSSVVKQTSHELEVNEKPFSIQRTVTDYDSSESVNAKSFPAEYESELPSHKNDSEEFKSISESLKDLKSVDIESENVTTLPINPKVDKNLRTPLDNSIPSLQNLSLEPNSEVLERTSKSASLEEKTTLAKKNDLGVLHSEINLKVDQNIKAEQSEKTLVGTVSKDSFVKDMPGLEFQEKNVYPDKTIEEVEGEKSALALNIPESSARKLGLAASVSVKNEKTDQVNTEQLHESSKVAENALMKDKLGWEHVSSDVDASRKPSARSDNSLEGKIPDISFTNIKPSLGAKTLDDSDSTNKTAIGVLIKEVSIVSPHREKSGIADPILKTNSENEITVTNLTKLNVEPQITKDQIKAVNEPIGKPEPVKSIEGEPIQVGIEKQIEDVKEPKDKRLETDILPNDYDETKHADGSSIEHLNSVPISSLSLSTEVTSCDDSNAETSADFSSIGKDLDFFEDTIHYLKSATAQLTTMDDIFTEDEKKRQSGEGVIDHVADADSEITPKPRDDLYQVTEGSINQKENRSSVIKRLETEKSDVFDQAATVIQSAVRGYRVRRDLNSKQSRTLSIGDLQETVVVSSDEPASKEESKSDIKNNETASKALEQIPEKIDSKTKNLAKPDYTASHPAPPRIARENPIQKREKSVKTISLQQIENSIENKSSTETQKIKPSVTREKPIEKKSKPIKSDSLDETKTSVKRNSFNKGQQESPPERTKIPKSEKQKTTAKPFKDESGKPKSKILRSKVQSTSNLLERDRSAKSKRTQLGRNVRSVSVKEQNQKVNVFDLEAIKNDLLSTKKVRSSKNSSGRPIMPQQKSSSPIKFSKVTDSAKKSTNSIDKSKVTKGNVEPKQQQTSGKESSDKIIANDAKVAAVKSDPKMISDELQSVTKSTPTVKSLKENIDSSQQISATTIQKAFRGYRTRKHLKSVSDTEQIKNPDMTAVTEDEFNTVNADHVKKQSDDETSKNSKESDTSGIFDTLKKDVEDFKHTVLDKSATKIQKTYRGFRTRKSLKGDYESPRRSTEMTPEKSDVLNKAVESRSNLLKTHLSEENLNQKEKGQEKFVKLMDNFEDATNEALNKSATTIQKNFRGYKTRKNLKKAKSFESTSDKTFTIKSKSKEVGDTLNNDVTTCITTTKENLSQVQRVSPKIDENPNKDKEIGSSEIFEKLKRNMDSFKNAFLDKSAIKIQKTFRGYKTRKGLKNDVTGFDKASRNQTSDQTFAVEPKLLKTEIEENKDSQEFDTKTSGKIKSDVAENYKSNSLDGAAITIQKIFRGYKTRKVLKDDLRKINNVQGAKEIVNEKSTNILNDDGKTLTKESESKGKAKDNNLRAGIFDNAQSDVEESPALDEFATTIQKTFRGYKTRKEMIAKDVNLKAKNSDANLVQLLNSGTKSDEMLTSSQPQSGDVGRSESEKLSQLQKLSKNASNSNGMKKSKSSEKIAFNDVSEKAAITIQKTYKGFKARKELNTGGIFNKDIATKQPLFKNDVSPHITSNSEDAEALSEATTKVDTENSTISEREYLNAIHRDEIALDDPVESFFLIKKTNRAASAGALLGAAASIIQKAFRDYHSRKENTLLKTKSYSHGAQGYNGPKETIDTSDESSTFIGPDTSFDLSDIDSVGTKSTPTLEMEISNQPSFAPSIHSEGHDIENDATLVTENSLSVSPQRTLRKRSIIDATAPLLADILNAGESTDSNEKPQWYVGEDLIVPSTDTSPSTFQNPLASPSSFDKSSSIDSRNDSFISNLQPTPSINSAVVSTSSLLFDTKDTEMHDTIKNTPKHLNKHSRAVSADEEEKRTEKETAIRIEVKNCQEADKADEKQNVDEEDVFEEKGASLYGLTDLAESLMLTNTDPFSPRNSTEDVKDASQAIVTELCKDCADGVHEVHEEAITMASSGGKLPDEESSDKTENRAVNPDDTNDITQSTNKHFDEIKQFVLMDEEPKTTERSSENNESKAVNETNGNDTETSAVKNVKEQGHIQMSNATSNDGPSELPLVTVDQLKPKDDDTNVGPSIAFIPPSSEEETSDRESTHEKIYQSEKSTKREENNVTAAEKEKSPSEGADSNGSKKSYSEKQQSVDICQKIVNVKGDEVTGIDIVGECEKVAVDSTDSSIKTKHSETEGDLKGSIKKETKIKVDSTETEKILNDLTDKLEEERPTSANSPNVINLEQKSEDILQDSTTVKSHEPNLDGALILTDMTTDTNSILTKPTKGSQDGSKEGKQNGAIGPEETEKSLDNDIDVKAKTVVQMKAITTTELHYTEDAENGNTTQQGRKKDSEDSEEYIAIDKLNEDSSELSSNIVLPLDIGEKSEDTLKNKTNEDQKFEDNFNESCTDKIAVEEPIKVIQESRLSSVVSADKKTESTRHESLKIDEENETNSKNGGSKIVKSKFSSDSTKEEIHEIPADIGLLEDSKLKRAESSHRFDFSNENVDEGDVSKSKSNTGELNKVSNDLEPKALSEEGEVQNKSRDELPSEEKTASDSGNSNQASTLEEPSKEPESPLTDGIHKQSSKDAENNNNEVKSKDRSVDLEKSIDHSEDPGRVDINPKSDGALKAAEKKDPELKSEDRSVDLEQLIDHNEDPGKVDINPKSDGALKAAEKKDPELKSEDRSVDLEQLINHSEDPDKVDIGPKSDADMKAAEKKDPELKSEDRSVDMEKSIDHSKYPNKVDINPKSSKEGAAPITEHKVNDSKEVMAISDKHNDPLPPIDSAEDLEIASKLLEGCLHKTDHSHSLGGDKQPSLDGKSANVTTDVKSLSEDVKSKPNSPEELSLSDESLTIQANLEKLIDESVRQIENDVNPINPQDLPVENSPNEVVEVPCVKKILPPTPLSETSDQDESELESTTTKAESTTTSPGYDGASDNDALEIPPSLPDSLEAMAEKLRETEEMVARMHQRRASEQKISIEIADQPPAFEDRVSDPIRPMRELQKSSSTELEDDIILQKLQRGNTTRESSAQSDSVVFGDSTSQLTESEDTFGVKPLHRMNTIAVDRNSYKPSNLLQKSVTIDETVKYIDPEKSTEESGGSFCLDDAISADVRTKMMAYSISEADSDYYDAGEPTARLHDDFNISTALDTFPSSDTDTTIVSAARKIQAGARGFLTRRRLRRASMGTKSSLNGETKTSFGNDAGESLDRLLEEEDAKRKPKVQYHRQVGVNSLPSALGNSTETETPSGEQIHAGDDSDDLNLAAKLTSVAEKISATPHGEGSSSIDGQRGNRNLSTASENDVNGGQETDDESAQVPPNLEATLAARRLTLQRGDAMRNDSTPDDDNGNAKQVDPAKSIPAAAAGTMSIQQITMVDSTTTGTTPAETTTTTITTTTTTERRNYSDAAMTIKMDKVKWFAMRQNSMPVQIDSEVFRVLPKHMRKRIKSAEGEQRKRIRLPRD